MGSLIQDTISDAIKALVNGDIELAQKIIDSDTKLMIMMCQSRKNACIYRQNTSLWQGI